MFKDPRSLFVAPLPLLQGRMDIPCHFNPACLTCGACVQGLWPLPSRELAVHELGVRRPSLMEPHPPVCIPLGVERESPKASLCPPGGGDLGAVNFPAGPAGGWLSLQGARPTPCPSPVGLACLLFAEVWYREPPLSLGMSRLSPPLHVASAQAWGRCAQCCFPQLPISEAVFL